MNKIYTSKHI